MQATMARPLNASWCATIRGSSAAYLPRAGGGSTRSWACLRVQSPVECRRLTDVSQLGGSTLLWIPQAAVLALIEGERSGVAGPAATLRMVTGAKGEGVELKCSSTPLDCVTQCCERSAICSAFVSGMPGWCRTPPWKVLI